MKVVLVHGTWGRGFIPRPGRSSRPRWFERGSPFRETLHAALLARRITLETTEQVEWSGSNAFGEREHAAVLLAGHLDRLHEADPGTTRLVIGHSHGGNVCLRAFAHLGRPADGIRVVTLATPFVELLEDAAVSRTAPLVITLAARLSHVSTAFAVGIAGRAGQVMLIAVRLGLIGLAAYLVGEGLAGIVQAHALSFALAAAPVFALVLVALALAEGMAPAVFGRELFLTFRSLQVNSNSAPDAGEHVRVVTLPPAAATAGLRHALYAHPDCAGRIAEWLDPSAPKPSTGPPAPL